MLIHKLLPHDLLDVAPNRVVPRILIVHYLHLGVVLDRLIESAVTFDVDVAPARLPIYILGTSVALVHPARSFLLALVLTVVMTAFLIYMSTINT